MTRVRTWATYKRKKFVDLGHQNSTTIPDQAVSIKQILAQHSRGMPLPAERAGQYFGDSDHVPDFEVMDKMEILDWKRENQDRIQELKAEIQRMQEVEPELPPDPTPPPTPDPTPQPPDNQ